jgi:hypothetical protein
MQVVLQKKVIPSIPSGISKEELAQTMLSLESNVERYPTRAFVEEHKDPSI